MNKKQEQKLHTFLFAAMPHDAHIVISECIKLASAFKNKPEFEFFSLNEADFKPVKFLDDIYYLFLSLIDSPEKEKVKNLLIFELFENGSFRSFGVYNQLDEPIVGSYMVLNGKKIEFGYASDDDDYDYWYEDSKYDEH